MRKALFFIAIIPPQPIESEVMEFKRYTAKNYNSRKALNSPAHITLIPPFKFEDRAVPELLVPLYKAAEQMKPFYVSFDNFDHFSNKVIFVKVEKNSQLDSLQMVLGKAMTEILGFEIAGKPFHPHATVAFRDLDTENYKDAWSHFKAIDYIRVFEVKDFYLLKHSGKVWEVINRFSFNK